MTYVDTSGHSYYGTKYDSFEELYAATIENPQEVEEMLYKLNETEEGRENLKYIIKSVCRGSG